MNNNDLFQVRESVSNNIGLFHEARLRRIQTLKLMQVLKRKNLYLFRAKNVFLPETLIRMLVDAWLSSSEEGLFGNFLENLALFVAKNALNGQKSSVPGIDLEFIRDEIRLLVAIKS